MIPRSATGKPGTTSAARRRTCAKPASQEVKRRPSSPTPQRIGRDRARLGLAGPACDDLRGGAGALAPGWVWWRRWPKWSRRTTYPRRRRMAGRWTTGFAAKTVRSSTQPFAVGRRRMRLPRWQGRGPPRCGQSDPQCVSTNPNLVQGHWSGDASVPHVALGSTPSRGAPSNTHRSSPHTAEACRRRSSRQACQRHDRTCLQPAGRGRAS